MVAEVHCVAENGGKKIRARIVAHINEEGLRQAGVYDNSYNCQFPRAIRAEGKVFHVPDEDVRLRCGAGGTYFYSIKKQRITDVTGTSEVAVIDNTAKPSKGVKKPRSEKAKPVKEYEVSPECVICMGLPSTIVFVPCGHLCTCPTCGNKIKKCCICRVPIDSMISK